MLLPVLLKRHEILCFVTLMTLMLNSVSSLDCVQCVSLHTPSCYSGNQPVTPCTGQDARAKYCYKTLAYNLVTGHASPGSYLLSVVTRGCADHEHNNCSDDTKVSGEQYKKCFYTCKEDGCNGSSQLRPKTGTMVLGLTIALILWRGVVMSLAQLCRWML